MIKKGNSTGTKSKIFNRRNFVIAVVLLIAVFAVRTVINRNVITTQTSTTEKGDITESVSASGKVTAKKKAVLTFQSAGEIESINADEGDWVNKGQLIAKLSTTNLYQAYLSAEANLRAAQASLDSTYDTIQGHSTDETFAQRSTRTTAEATKDVAYRNFIQASQNLSNARIVAPFSGILTDISDGTVAGANVSIASSAFTIVDPSTVYFSADVNEVDVAKLVTGQKVFLTIDAYPDEEFEELISDISFSSIATTTGGTAYPVYISLPITDTEKFRLGMNGDADFVLNSKKDVLLTPATSVVEEGEKEYVWAVIDDKAKRVEVKTGSSTIDHIEIIEGLSEGQLVVSRPPKEIKEGMRIKSMAN